MKTFARFIGSLIFFLAIAAQMGAQQGKPMVMKDASTSTYEKLDPTLPWISEYHAPVIYHIWWSEIARCEGLPVPWDKVAKVQYFQVNAPDFVPEDVPVVVLAVTYEEGQTFVAYPHIWNKTLIQHEAVHFLRLWAGDPNWTDHNPRYYERCGIVAAGTPFARW